MSDLWNRLPLGWRIVVGGGLPFGLVMGVLVAPTGLEHLVDALARAGQAAQALGWTLQPTADGRLEGSTGPSAWSWGERIEVVADEVGGQTTLTVSSRPWLPTTLVDYGVNAGNVERMAAVLALADAPAEAQADEEHDTRAARHDARKRQAEPH
jgi:hypothetical protein